MVKTPLPDPDAFLGYTIARLSHALSQRVERALSPTGLSVRQFGVLAHLSESPGLASAEIARLVLVTPQSMGALVETLVKRGLVARDAIDTSGVKVRLQLTPLGKAELDRGYRIVQAEQSDLARLIGKGELTKINRELQRLLAALSE